MIEDERNPNNCNANNDIQNFFVLLDDISSHTNSIAKKLCGNGSHNCNTNNDFQNFFVLLDDLPHILIV